MFKKFFLLVALILSLPAYTQTPLTSADLSIKNVQPSWMNVAGGAIVGSPCPTTTGFCFATDGRILTSVTEKGEIIWQKPLQAKVTPFIASSTTLGDFIALVTGTKTLSLINPSGSTIWQRTLPFEPTSAPIFGRDGRIFIKGKKDFLCMGIKGSEKYSLKLGDLSNSAPLFFNDGSILLILATLKDGKTQGQRISPFGKVLEKITFTSVVKDAASCDKGILVALENGDCALLAVKDGKAAAVWNATLGSATQKGKSGVAISGIDGKDEAVFLFQDGSSIKCTAVKKSTGEVKKIFPLGQGDLSSYKKIRSTDQGVFITDSQFAREFSPDGTIFWEAKLPPKKQWSNTFYSEKNYLVLCRTSWVIDAFLMRQSATKKTSKFAASEKRKQENYDSFYKVTKFSNEDVKDFKPLFKKHELKDIKTALIQGGYGEKEEDWASRLKTEIDRYKNLSMSQVGNIRANQTYFDSEFEYTKLLFELAGFFETDEFTNDIAYLLATEKKSEIRCALLIAAKNSKLDRQNEILSEIQDLLTSSKVHPANKTEIFLICDAVYEIAGFMGRDALDFKGRDILNNFFYPKFDSEVKDYARKTLQKIAELKI